VPSDTIAGLKPRKRKRRPFQTWGCAL